MFLEAPLFKNQKTLKKTNLHAQNQRQNPGIGKEHALKKYEQFILNHICLESNLVNFDIPKTLKTVLDSPKRALSNRTMGGPLSKNVPVTPLRYKFHDFLLLIY